MKIGKLSKVSGCSIQTIRYYEKENLISNPNRSEGNFRLYDNNSLKELEFVKHCRSLDIPLSDIKRLIELKQSPEESCSSVNTLIDDQLKLVNQRIIELKSLKKELQIMASSCSSDNNIDQCGIIKSLVK
ncbi:MAG: Cd(II)/Pb(II)-responsive transcriptional regulator [Cognaticolwellia aestuarii]